jgi:hypothetical protein
MWYVDFIFMDFLQRLQLSKIAHDRDVGLNASFLVPHEKPTGSYSLRSAFFYDVEEA